ncbi:hypothetical protein GGR54DRAFT_412379 [Hypoxylon sp. NC1633]|nr:hypothetical protein GGR54DRAFT_412379 [Hypoxylon sp. NC1633]
MRPSIWMIVPCLMATASALPTGIPPAQNVTSWQNTTATYNTSATYNITSTHTEGIIPVTDIYCSGHKLPSEDVLAARLLLAKWGQQHRIPPKTVKRAYAGEALFYVCNCKGWYADPVPALELMDAQELIWDRCGDDATGRVFSKPWDKVYEIEPRAFLDGVWRPPLMCPNNCVRYEWFKPEYQEPRNDRPEHEDPPRRS